MLLQSENQIGSHATYTYFYFMDQEVINKASKTLDFVKYALYQFDLSVKVDAYNTLMRPILFKIRINNI